MNEVKIEELISKKAISKRVEELAEEINHVFGNQPVTIVCVLKGAAIFMADLVRHLNFPIDIEFMELSSYKGKTSTGEVVLKKDLAEDFDISGKNVLIIEDIVDTGISLQFILNLFAAQNPAALKSCVLLDNPHRRKIENMEADFTGFIIPNKFVVGYGLDYNQDYRQLPYVGVMDQ